MLVTVGTLMVKSVYVRSLRIYFTVKLHQHGH